MTHLLHLGQNANFSRPSTSRSTEFVKALEPPPLTPPKRVDQVCLRQSPYLILLFILPTKIHPDLSTISVFQDFGPFFLVFPNYRIRSPVPKLPQREQIQYGYVDHVSMIFAYSTHEVSSRFLHSKRFPRFPVLPMSRDLVGI